MPSRHRVVDPDATQVLVDHDATQVLAKVPSVSDVAAVSAPVPRGRRRRRIAILVVSVLVVLGGGGVAAAGLYLRSVDSAVKRVEAFGGVPEAGRPSKPEAAQNATNFLVLGSDTRDPANTGGSRSDTIILLHLDKAKTNASLVSIPRDTWLHIPKSSNGKQGNVNAKINAAYAFGGVPLTVQTVEAYTGVRIDHVLMVDFAGFKEIVDALGGINIEVSQGFTSRHSLNKNSVRVFRKGPQVMDGAAALDYARERFAFTDGDFTRIQHQQQVIKAVLAKAATGGLLTNPADLNSFLKATANAVTVDAGLNIFDTAMALRHLRSENLTFYTSPNKGTGTVGTESVVLPDVEKAKVFFNAIRLDEPIPPTALPTTPPGK